MNGSSVVTYDLEAGMEWRFELEQGEAIAVRVSGLAVSVVLFFLDRKFKDILRLCDVE
jgi:hypothetical protein